MRETTSTGRQAVIYVRVSDRKQEKNGHGLDSQETRCREFASYRKHEVVKVFYETISGGKQGRPAMKAMLEFLKRHRTVTRHVVLIDDITRLARDIEIHKSLRRSIKAAGGDLESPSVVFGDSSDSLFFENMQALNSEYQRVKNGEQVVNRMRSRLLGGHFILAAPVGYIYAKLKDEGKRLVPNEPVASIVREALEGFASGRFATQADVQRFLQTQPDFPKDRQGRVHRARVPEMLNRIVYTGYFEMPAWNVSLRKGTHEPLISYETYQKIQARLKAPRRTPARKDFNEDFPLRGYVSCADCCQPLRAAWTKGRDRHHPYYICHTKTCVSYGKSIKRAVIEGEFETLLAGLKPSRDLFEAIHVLMKAWWDDRIAKAKNGLSAFKAELIQLERQAEKLVDLVIDAPSADLRARYEDRLRQIEADKIAVKEKLVSDGKPPRSFDAAYRTAMMFLANPLNLWHSPRLENKRTVLKLTFSERLIYSRFEGYRTPATSMPFRLFGAFDAGKEGMVDATGIEPVTPSMSTRCSPAELRVRQSGPEALRKASGAGRCGGIAAAFEGRKPTCSPPGENFRRPSSFRLRRRGREGARAWTAPWRRPERGPEPTGPRRRSR